MMKINKKFALLLAVFVIPFVISACGSTKKDDMGKKTGAQMNKQVEEKEVLVPDDKIEFSDPGNDEIGKEIKEMDDLLNQTSPSEYNEEDLSESAVGDEIELK